MENFIAKALGLYLNLVNLISNKIGGKQAFYIFCFPFKAKLKKHHQEFLDTAHKFKLEIEGADIQCYRWGSGSKNLLFVHGWQSNAFRWKKHILDLPHDEYTLYAFDAPGHGNSAGKISNVPLFEKSIETLNKHIGEFDTMVSHSIGSFSSLYFVDQHPTKQPKKLISLATPNSVEDFIEFYFKKLKLSQKTIRNFRSFFSDYVQKDLSYFNLSNILKNNIAKGLIVHDQNDNTVTPEYSKYLHSIWPTSKLVLTNGFGHKLNDDSIVSMVNSFIINSHEEEGQSYLKPEF